MNLLNKYHFSMGLILLCLISCQPKSSSEQLFEYAKEQGIEIHPTTRAIVVLSNKGCVSCNKAFLDFSKDFLNQAGVQYILAANGGLLDIRPFLSSKSVSFDKKHIIHKKGLIEKSGVFFLNEEQHIDTLVNIEAKSIHQAAEYIKQRLDALSE